MSDELFLFEAWLEVQVVFEATGLSFAFWHGLDQSKILCRNYTIERLPFGREPENLRDHLRVGEDYTFIYIIRSEINGVHEVFPIRFGNIESLRRFQQAREKYRPFDSIA